MNWKNIPQSFYWFLVCTFSFGFLQFGVPLDAHAMAYSFGGGIAMVLIGALPYCIIAMGVKKMRDHWRTSGGANAKIAEEARKGSGES